MTKDETLKMLLVHFELWNHGDSIFYGEFDYQINAIKEALANDATNDTSQERVDKTSEIVHEAQRTWVGLTDEEIKDCFKITPDQHLPWHIYQRIEARLKEKNT